ncbi:MAG TPA: TolC family protein, partial [Burkholderiaceae bacterium]|nr:TolC family protein [Burkholderiaceae bacterium]
HSSTRDAADAESRRADLDLLWQEWQTVARARQLFVEMGALAETRAVLLDARARLRGRLDDALHAVDEGLITRDASTPLRTAYEDASRQWADAERQRNQALHDLDALLGLAPDVEPTLVGGSDLPILDEARVHDALAVAGLRRPDLLALQAGFQAQDDRYRGAIRAQFPALTVGPTRARDTSFVDTSGFALGITLPLFNRNRGNIAIEAATREKLRNEYQQRLDATASDAHRLLVEQDILRRQLADIDGSLPLLLQSTERAEVAFEARDIDALTLTSTEGALLSRRLERIATEQALQEQAIALEALLGTQLDNPVAPTAQAHAQAQAQAQVQVQARTASPISRAPVGDGGDPLPDLPS